ncbi:MAG: OpgC domain-containing protein [Vibrio gallaecicus]
MQRNHSIDTIRGALLLIMTINHFIWITVGWAGIQLITLQPFGQVGAAEGFILVSGLMVGLIYTGADAASNKKKLLTRAKQLYIYHLIAILAVLTIAYCFISFSQPANTFYSELFPGLIGNTVPTLVASFTLLHKPPYFDILPMYVAFLLISPLIISQLKKKRIYWVITISVLLWLGSRYFDLSTLLTLYFAEGTINTGYFSWLAWQLIFVVGICLGYCSRHQPINWFKHPAITFLVSIIALVLFVFQRNIFAQYGIHQGTLYELADKPLLGWLRIFNLFLLVYLFGYIIHRWPQALTFKPLALLGRHSLYVFSWHYVVIFSVAPIALGFFDFQPNITVCLVIVSLLIFVPALIRERNKSPKPVVEKESN